MAVRAGAVIGGLALRPGSLRLIALRVVTLLLFSLPALLAARCGITDQIGHDPRLVPAEPQAFEVVSAVLRDLPPAALLSAGLAAALFWLFEQALVASTLILLSPALTAGPTRIWATLWGRGWPQVSTFIRVGLVDLVLAAGGLSIVSLIGTRLDRAADAGGWRGITQVVVMPGLVILLAWLWLTVVGTFGLWCRVLIVADGRRRVRRVLLLALRALYRAPFRGLGAFVAIAFGSHLLGAVFLVVQAPGKGGSLVASSTWLVYLLVQAYVWHWLLHAGRRLYAEKRFAAVREGSDQPFGVWRGVTHLVRGYRQRKATRAAPGEESKRQ